MSEAKRAKLISFGSQRVNGKNSQEAGKTVRIAVKLPESTEDNCPEFNYKDMFAAAKRKNSTQTTLKQVNGLDPFNDDDEDVKRIAAEMEAKYGMGVTKKRKWRKDDYADIGMGYDESDSFIDNTDGYDEIIPKNVTTLHGGFYINCGALEFKTDEEASSDESSSSDEDAPDKAANRKRVLESSAESEEEMQAQTDKQEQDVEPAEKKQKLVTNTNGMQKAIKKRLFSHNKIKQQIRKKRQEDTTKKTVRELLRERREDLNMTVVTDSESPEKAEPATTSTATTTITPTTTIAATPVGSPKDKKPLASVDDVIESVISAVAKKKEEPIDESSKDSIGSKEAVNSKSALTSSEADSNDGTLAKPAEIVQLPENLPSDIIAIIDSIKKAAQSSTEGKVKFFSGPVNTMLLNLERKCRCLGKQSRMKVYEHLAPFVKCRKETLIKRAKNLCVVEEQKKIKVLLDRLKVAVGLIMPPLIATYEAECQSVMQRKFCSQNEEAAKSLRMPKRQFVWNDEIKKLVKDIIILRKKCYINEGKQKESLEKHLTEFIKAEMHVIWPDGWMSMNTLLKYCNVAQDIRKTSPEVAKKVISITPDLNIVPAGSLPPTPSISLSCTSSLTITPVNTNVHKVASSELKAKPKPLNLSETIISKVTSDNCSISKPSKTLPGIDIVKTSVPDVTSGKYTSTSTISREPSKPPEPETIVIEEKAVKEEEPENLSSHVNVIKHEPPKENSSTHCQIIDLTETPEVRKKPGPKNKPKYLYDFTDKLPKPKKDVVEHLRLKPQEEITGSSALTQIIADSLSDLNRYSQSSGIPKSSNNTAYTSNPGESAVKKSGPCTSYESDDIQKVMQNLKVLHNMSSPVKSSDEVKRSSPVSVIAYNKSYSSHDTNSMPHPPNLTQHRSSSFQDAFQKHFIPDYHMIRANQTTSPPKGGQNSITKHNHLSTKSSSATSERYLQNSNNNYAQQNSNKLKSNCSSQQSGSYNLLDDMFANFLSEYGHSKTANSKSSTPHK